MVENMAGETQAETDAAATHAGGLPGLPIS
jgi:hypothetical protein